MNTQPETPITVTGSGPRLRLAQTPGFEGSAVYGLAAPMQISPTEVALFLNLRVCGVPVVDLEAGVDLLIFDDLDGVRCELPAWPILLPAKRLCWCSIPSWVALCPWARCCPMAPRTHTPAPVLG